MSQLNNLLHLIHNTVPACGDWCTIEKAERLASLVMAYQPLNIVEIGVWMGGSLFPMALAAREYGGGYVTGIDPWDSSKSVQGQEGANHDWWQKAPHDYAYKFAVGMVEQLSLTNVSLCRMTSDEAIHRLHDKRIDLWHCDGNHSEQAYVDTVNYSPLIPVGGIAVMDDIGWQGGGVAKGVQHLLNNGFRKLYNLDTGAVFQRVK